MLTSVVRHTSSPAIDVATIASLCRLIVIAIIGGMAQGGDPSELRAAR
jgi:hypothetical protein